MLDAIREEVRERFAPKMEALKRRLQALEREREALNRWQERLDRTDERLHGSHGVFPDPEEEAEEKLQPPRVVASSSRIARRESSEVAALKPGLWRLLTQEEEIPAENEEGTL